MLVVIGGEADIQPEAILHRYLTNVCQHCAIKHRCPTGKERRITR
jgi:hypothetical protein